MVIYSDANIKLVCGKKTCLKKMFQFQAMLVKNTYLKKEPLILALQLHLLATLGAQKAVTLAGTPVPAMDMATLNLLVRAIGTAPAAV